MTPASRIIRIFFALMVLSASCATAMAAEKMAVLDQVSRLYGPVTVYLARDSVKVENESKDRVFLCKAPSWDVIMYNQKRKVIFSLPFSVWSKNGIQTPLWFESNDALRQQPHSKESQTNYAGLHAAAFWYPDRKSPGFKVADYIVTDEIQSDAKARRFLQALYDVPWVDGTPLRFRRVGSHSFGFGLAYNRKQNIRMCLQTKSVKMAALDKKQFEIPANYKAVKENDVFFDPNKADDAYADLMGE